VAKTRRNPRAVIFHDDNNEVSGGMAKRHKIVSHDRKSLLQQPSEPIYPIENRGRRGALHLEKE
jgi:hypothetical protein